MRRTVFVALVSVLVVLSGCGSGTGDSATRAGSRFSPEGQAAAQHFLETYVADDGRVLRHDQGDDVVSEGQAYGMLVAELVHDDATVRRIWTWTRDHLRRPDGLLSFHADSAGHVLDPESAADADILAAYALLRYDGSGSSSLHHDGRRLAGAVLAGESAPVGADGIVPVAGSWARHSPYAVNPSYWMPGVADALADLTHDDRWRHLADTTTRLVAEVTADGTSLPPDWAQLSGDRLQATDAPDGSHQPQYGPDAQRVPLFFEAACDGHARRLAASWWRLVSAPDRSAALALALDGSVADQSRAPLAMLAAAAAARAAGDKHQAARLVGSATDQTRSTPTYYGDAWLALAAGLAERQLAGC